jgi:hypothetical protein
VKGLNYLADLFFGRIHSVVNELYRRVGGLGLRVTRLEEKINMNSQQEQRIARAAQTIGATADELAQDSKDVQDRMESFRSAIETLKQQAAAPTAVTPASDVDDELDALEEALTRLSGNAAGLKAVASALHGETAQAGGGTGQQTTGTINAGGTQVPVVDVGVVEPPRGDGAPGSSNPMAQNPNSVNTEEVVIPAQPEIQPPVPLAGASGPGNVPSVPQTGDVIEVPEGQVFANQAQPGMKDEVNVVSSETPGQNDSQSTAGSVASEVNADSTSNQESNLGQTVGNEGTSSEGSTRTDGGATPPADGANTVTEQAQTGQEPTVIDETITADRTGESDDF